MPPLPAGLRGALLWDTVESCLRLSNWIVLGCRWRAGGEL